MSHPNLVSEQSKALGVIASITEISVVIIWSPSSSLFTFWEPRRISPTSSSHSTPLFKYYHNIQRSLNYPSPHHTHTYTHTQVWSLKHHRWERKQHSSYRWQFEHIYQNYKYFSTQQITLENLSYRLTHNHVAYDRYKVVHCRFV